MIPGFTTISMYSKMGSERLTRLIAPALERHADKQQLRTSM